MLIMVLHARSRLDREDREWRMDSYRLAWCDRESCWDLVKYLVKGAHGIRGAMDVMECVSAGVREADLERSQNYQYPGQEAKERE